MPALELHLYGFLTLVLTGVAAGLAFDVLRAIRRRLLPGRPVAPLLDLAYGVALGGLLGAGLFLANRGELRLYVFLGVATGAALYFTLGSPVVLWTLEGILSLGALLAGWVWGAVQVLVIRPGAWVAGRFLWLLKVLGQVAQGLGRLAAAPLRPGVRRARRWAGSTWVGRALRRLLAWLLPPADPGGPPGEGAGGDPGAGGAAGG